MIIAILTFRRKGRIEMADERRIAAILRGRIVIRMGDIAGITADAVVNAANSTLLGGGGVDGMIHWAAGSGLLEECRSIGWCPAGEARITGGYNLPARYIIHAVGPVYGVDRENAPRLLASCYRNSLALAAEYGLKSIAFPAISCGAYGYPVKEACRIALDSTVEFLLAEEGIERVSFVLYNCRDYEVYMEYYAGKAAIAGVGLGL
jgi:O-acetyl-ADP-ribose deacetylase